MTESKLVWFTIISEDSESLESDFTKFYDENNRERGMALFSTKEIEVFLICSHLNSSDKVISTFKKHGVIKKSLYDIPYQEMKFVFGDKRALEL
jgi:hypothetical protein